MNSSYTQATRSHIGSMNTSTHNVNTCKQHTSKQKPCGINALTAQIQFLYTRAYTLFDFSSGKMTNCTVCGRLYMHQKNLNPLYAAIAQPGLTTCITCDQCWKKFNRKDNLLKHLRHCTGHRHPPPPPPPPQQQQHADEQPPPPPTFTISHRYRSMGGAVKRYNIDMQETQHLDHPFTSSPPPTTNNDNLPRQKPCLQVSGCHHDCVSQSGVPKPYHTTTTYPNPQK